MSLNIEIKSIISDCERTKERLKSLGIREAYSMYQRDIFYQVPFGRLKLRSINSNQHELIIYFRHNSKKPKPSKYHRIHTNYPDLINNVLTRIFGIRGVVEKNRLLFLQNNIRFHIDQVKNLGNYFEIEYIVGDAGLEAYAQEKVYSLLNLLEISERQLVSESYIDLLVKGNAVRH